jgi:hypothetical protein
MRSERLRAAREVMAALLAACSPHELAVVVMTEPSGARLMELRRMSEGRTVVARGPYSAVLLAELLAEGVRPEYRAVVRLPQMTAP